MDNLLKLAELHASRLQEDIKLCLTRQEHIRMTGRANEAAEIVSEIRKLNNG